MTDILTGTEVVNGKLFDDEEWRPTAGFESYEVSNYGRVRSLDRTVSCADGRFKMRLRGRILKPMRKRGDYDGFSFSVRGKLVNVRAHRLVAEAFIGPIPDDLYVCHNDGNPRNNHVSNLRIDTPSSNSADKIRHGTDPRANKTHCNRGHILAGPNLRQNQAGRRCIACHRASAYVRQGAGRGMDMQVAADAYYAKIMGSEMQEGV